MGCDIHAYIELLEDGQWNLHSTQGAYTGRNYMLFGMLAGVRSYHPSVTPIVPPRGLPKDMSDGLRAIVDTWKDTGRSTPHYFFHTPSYLYVEELLEHWESIDQVSWEMSQVVQTMENLMPDGAATHSVRLVFWFDS